MQSWMTVPKHEGEHCEVCGFEVRGALYFHEARDFYCCEGCNEVLNNSVSAAE